MNKKCGKCAKTVYPTEELKCLDKSWHKGCFRCWECGMALNMRTYKGFNKLPYCEAHIPKPKATTVADTPEMARIAENTKIQSNVKYHADFEAAKGKFTTVADDPETLRIKANTKIISNVAYHGDLEKKAAMDQQRQLTGENGDPAAPPPASSGRHERAPPPASSAPPPAAAAPASHPQTARLSNNNYGGGGGGTPQSGRTQQASTLIYTSQHGAVNSQPQQRVGSIHEYDPINEQYGSSAGRYNPPPQHQQQQYQPPPQQQQQQYRQPQQQYHQPQQQQYAPQQQQYHPQQQQQQYPPQQYGGYQQQQQPQYGGYRQDHGGYRSQQVYRSEQPPQQHQQHHHRSHQQPAPPPQAHQPPPSGRCCRALYDYEAADTDEISFREGDLMVGCQPIDDGWMTGTCQRTGQRGMLPANYVEPVDL